MQSDDAFTEFARDAGPRLQRTAWLLTGNQEEAHDLAQEALVRTYVAWSRVRPSTALAYARKAMVNESVSRWRRRRDVPVGELLDVRDDSDADRFETRDRVLRMLSSLTDRQRQVLVLRFFEDLTEQRVADTLGLRLGTVKSTAFRALEQLRTHYSSAAEEEAR